MQLTHRQENKASWLKDILFLSLVLGGLFFILLGSRPLFVPDEGRYAEIAREMVSSGDYITPYLNGIKYFEKPALFYWLESAAIHLWGVNLWSVRSVNALLGLLGCILTYCSCRDLYNRNTGLLAAFILGTSSLYFVMAHMASLDLPVTFFLSLALYAFLKATQQPVNNTQRLYLFCSSIACACAVLTKGLIGFVFPCMIIALWIALLSEWRMLSRLALPSCSLVFLLVATPWHVIVNYRNPEFFYFYFIQQQFLRYTTLHIGHYQPAWFFIPALIAGFFPWIVFLPQTLAHTLKTTWKNPANKSDLFFLIWAVTIFIFFSFSKSKLIPYILPVFPPLSILTARYLQSKALYKPFALRRTFIAFHESPSRRASIRGVNTGFVCLFLASIFIAIVFFLFPEQVSLPDTEMAIHRLYPAAAILLFGTGIACFYHSRQLVKSLVITITTSCVFLLFSFASMPAIDTRTILPLTNQLNSILTEQDEVVAYNQYFQDLPFYLQRRITILNWQNELSYGMAHQDTHAWMIKDPAFWQRFHAKHRMFVLMGKKEYEHFMIRHAKEQHYLIAQTGNTVLISNQKLINFKPSSG